MGHAFKGAGFTVAIQPGVTLAIHSCPRGAGEPGQPRIVREPLWEVN